MKKRRQEQKSSVHSRNGAATALVQCRATFTLSHLDGSTTFCCRVENSLRLRIQPLLRLSVLPTLLARPVRPPLPKNPMSFIQSAD